MLSGCSRFYIEKAEQLSALHSPRLVINNHKIQIDGLVDGFLREV